MQILSKPFPTTLKDGRLVINEVCRCGHLRTEDQDALRGIVVGHGRCKKSRFCGCTKFSWASRIFKSNTKPRK